MIQAELKPLLRRIITISYEMRLGHIGSCITALPIINEIYKIKKPDEKVIISCGHAHLAHLVVKESEGLIDFKRGQSVEGLIKEYGIHCDRQSGCDVSTGSLGHGIGIAVGIALADRTKNVYCLLSDGEMAEGSVWEALRIAAECNLRNLKVYINNNGWAAYKKLGSIDWLFGEGDYPLHDPVEIKTVKTDLKGYSKWLQGQIAHYKVLNESEYNELMEILK